MIEFDPSEPLVIVTGDPVNIARKNFNRIKFFDNFERLVRECCAGGYTTFVTYGTSLFAKGVCSYAMTLTDKYPSIEVVILPFDRVNGLLSPANRVIDLGAEYRRRYCKIYRGRTFVPPDDPIKK